MLTAACQNSGGKGRQLVSIYRLSSLATETRDLTGNLRKTPNRPDTCEGWVSGGQRCRLGGAPRQELLELKVREYTPTLTR